jgi:murein DD-endopeptidase MepM/ murein hydrolase activator NlpD
MTPPVHHPHFHPKALAAALIAALAVTACQEPTGTGMLEAPDRIMANSHGAFTQSTGMYRIPYANGTNLTVTRDHHDHTPPDRIDMGAGVGTPVVAAATGVIRGIVDNHGRAPNAGDGVDINGNAQLDSLEHSCGNNDPANTVVGGCVAYNNYVWIEHANGEWTKYTHLGTGTVQLPPPFGFGWSVGDTILAGQTIGLESDIGQATSNSGNPAYHLHHEVAIPNTPGTPLTWGSGGIFNNGSNVVPRVCGIPNNLYVSGQSYTANPCVNAPPVADAGGPYVVDEGSPLVLDGSGSVDPDGLPLTYRWTPGDGLDDSTIVSPTFMAGDETLVNITLTVFDQVESLSASDNTTITVNNVAPVVTIDPAQVLVIEEGGTVTVTAEFTDAGWLDTHVAAVDWGVPPGHAGTEISAPAIEILEAGGPGTPRRGRVTASYRYGDNDSGAGFTIEVTVTDDDGAAGSDSFSLTVGNIDPDVAMDPAGTVLLNGVPTVVATEGEEVAFASQTDDAGSDDLTLAWDWDDGSSNSRTTLVNPPAADPNPSPTVQPRSELDQVAHTFGAACLYAVTFTATDDDAGESEASLDVVITGTADQVRSSGYWGAEYSLTKNPDHTPARLACYIDIVNHVSAVFSEARALATLADAADILKSNGSGGDADEIFDVQLLAAWLNFANGSYGLDELVDTDGDGLADASFLSVMQEAEALRTDAGRTRAAMMAMKDILDRLNNAG